MPSPNGEQLPAHGEPSGETVKIVVAGLVLLPVLVLLGPILHVVSLLVLGWALLRAPVSGKTRTLP